MFGSNIYLRLRIRKGSKGEDIFYPHAFIGKGYLLETDDQKKEMASLLKKEWIFSMLFGGVIVVFFIAFLFIPIHQMPKFEGKIFVLSYLAAALFLSLVCLIQAFKFSYRINKIKKTLSPCKNRFFYTFFSC